MSTYDDYLKYVESEDKKRKKKKQQETQNKNIAPVKTTTNNSGFFSEDTANAVKDFITNNKLANTWKEQFKTKELNDIWSNGYDFGDVSKTLLTGNRIFNPFVVTAEKVYNTGKKGVEKGKELVNGEGNFVKNSKAIDETKEELNKIWSNGWDFGDIRNTKNAIKKGVAKTILGTGADVGTNLLKGELQTAEGLVDTGRYIASDLVRATGYNETADKIKERAIQNTTGFILGENDLYNNPKQNGWSKKVDEYSVFDQKIDQITQNLGQQAFRIGLQKALMGKAPEGGATDKLVKGLNQLEIIAGSYGQAKSEALMNGYDETTARKRATISSLAEWLSENAFDNIPGFKTGGLKVFGKLKDKIFDSTEKALGKNMAKLFFRAFNGIGEGFEERLSNGLETLFTDFANFLDPNYVYGMQEGQGILNEKNPSFKMIKDALGSAFSKESDEAFWTALISTAITGIASDTANNAQRNEVIEAYAKDQNMSKEQAKQVFDAISQLRQNQLVDENTGFTERMETEENVNQQLQQEIQNGANLEELFKATPKTRAEQQFTFTNNERKNVKSDKQKVLANDMARLNNTKEVHDTYEIANRMQGLNDTHQYHVTTTEGLVELGIVTKDANGNYGMINDKGEFIPYVPRGMNYGKNGDIYLNADVGTKSGTQAMYHEIFEGFKKANDTSYKELKQMVRDVVGEKAIQDEIPLYKQMYGEDYTDIEDEIINDKFGEIAENQNFINKIADNRSVLEKFVDSIKNMIKYVKGTPQERQLIKLQNKLEKEFAKRYKKTDFSQNEGETAYSLNKNNLGAIQNLNNIEGYQVQEDYYPYDNVIGHSFGLKTKEGTAHLQIRETANEVYLNMINTRLGNSTVEKGAGTKILNNLKEYSDKTGKKLIIAGEVGSAKGFYDKFDWLKHTKGEIYDDEGNLFDISSNNRVYEPTAPNSTSKAVNNTAFSLEQIAENAKSPQEYKKLRNEYIKNNTTYNELNKNGLYTIKANIDGKYAGSIDYHIEDGSPKISYIYVGQDYRRAGIATELYKQLQQKYPNQEIVFGDLTNDGKKLLNEIATIRKNENDEYVGNIKYSLQSNKDSNGRTLSKEQQNFFKNSKVVDKDGNLIPVFRAGYEQGTDNVKGFFTNDKNAAKYYKNYFESDKWGGEGQIYEVYMNLENPLIVDAEGNWYQEVPFEGKELWTDDIVDIAKERGYDGVIIKNVAEGDDWGGFVIDDYVSFNPNQVKNIDNTNPTTSPDIRYSIATNKDSNGRELSKEQQEYFKDSKVVDEEGNLLEVYHGTNAQFNIFDKSKIGANTNNEGLFGKGFYFTNQESLADGYSKYHEGDNNVKRGYLNITNPFVWKSIKTEEQMNQFIKDNNIPEGTITWNPYQQEIHTITEVENERTFSDVLQEAGYDGIIYEYRQQDENHKAVQEIVAFESNQFKNIDNTNPTSNEDIRYSIAPSGEMVDNNGSKVIFDVSEVETDIPIRDDAKLMVLHNLGENKMNGIMDLDGIPVPSLAVTNPYKVDHNGFGEGTLIFRKETINPTNRLNEVYDRDIWSPTYPRIEYDIDNQVLRDMARENNFNTEEDEILSHAKLMYLYSENLSNIVDNGIDNALDRMKSDRELKYLYQKSTNPNYQAQFKTKEYSNRYSNETLQKYVDLYNSNKFNDMSLYDFWYHYLNYGDMQLTDDQKTALKATIRDIVYEEYIEDGKDLYNRLSDESKSKLSEDEYVKAHVDNELERFDKSYFDYVDFIRDAAGLDQYGNQLTIDEDATLKQVEQDTNQEEYEKWVEDTFGKMLRNTKKGIRNDKELFTPSGNRRSFDKLHEEYNLENLVKVLTSKDTVGGEEGFGSGSNFGTLQAKMGHKFNSIEDIKSYEDRLSATNNQDIEDLKNAIYDDMAELNNYKKYYSEYSYFDNAGYALNDYAEYKTQDLTNLKKALEKNDIDTTKVPTELLNKVVDEVNQLKTIPTDYFEAKPQRAVGLDEIGIGLIPQTWSEETKQRMKDKGIKYVEYDSTIPGERQRIEQSLTDYMFSLTSNQNIRSREIAPVNTTTEEQLAPIREDISNISNQLNNLSNQIETLQNGFENNPRGYVESYKEQRNENIPTRQLTEDEANLRQEALMNDEGYLRSLEEQANYDANDKFIKSLTNEIQPQLDVSKESKPRLEKLIRDAVENDLSADEINDRISREFSSYTTTFEDEGLQDVKKAIRRTPLKVDDFIKTDIADYNDFRKSNFGKMTFTNSGIPVDVAYEQLASEFPGYFPNDIVNPSDQLQYIAEVANNKGNTIQDSFEPDYLDNVSDYITDSILNYKANNQLDSQASLDKDIQFDFTEDIAPTVVRTQESVDNYIENRDIAPVRQEQVKPKSKFRDRLERMRTSFNEKIRNRNYIIDEYARATGNKEIKFTGDNLNNVSGEASFNINGYQTDTKGNRVGKGVHQIFEPARRTGLYAAFNDYLVQKSNIERHAVGKGSQVPLVVSQQLVQQYETENPQFKTWAKDVYKFFDNVLQSQVDEGLISQEKYNDFRGENGIYRSYVPFYPGEEIQSNIKFDDNGEVKSYTTLKKSKGNAFDVNKMLSVEDAMAKQTYAYKRAIRQNELFKEIVKSSEKYDAMFDGDMRDNPTNLDDSLFVDENGDKIVSAYINGQKVSAKISDDLYNELAGANEQRIKQLEQDFSLITNPLQKASNIRRKLITTWNPAFLMRNAIKDVQDAVINSKHTKDMLANLTGLKKGSQPAIIELAQAKTQEAQQFLALYGSELYGDYSNTQIIDRNKMSIPEQFQADWDNAAETKSYSAIGQKFTRLNELIELAPRYAEYKASLQNGESQNEALYNAREVTTNFGRGGYITKALNRNGFTFLNANVQGLDKVVRNLSGENGAKGVVSVITKGALFAVLPSILNDLLYGFGDDKDEEYEALPDYIKDNYYLIKTEGNHFVRIPKGRINAVFGSLARRTIETIETGENQYDGYIDNAWSQIGVGDLGGNNIFSPITQAFGSENGTAWYGGDIVPTRLQKKPAAEQTDASIDKISNFLGETFDISPYKINYVLDQYSGGIGDIFLPMITDETSSGAERVDEYLTAPLKDAFSVNSTDDNKYAGEFYDTKDKLEIAKNSANATDEDVLKYKYMSGVSTQLSDLYKERREVQSDTTLSNKQKYEKVQKIQDAINSLAKEAMIEYKNIKSTENYSSAGDGEFYKNDKGEWTSVKDADSEFTAGMTDTEKSSYYNVKNKIGVIYDDYNKKIKNLSKKDSKRDKYAQEKRDGISQAIINSGLDDYSKAILYSKYYVSGDKNFTAQEKMTNVYNAGFDIDTYITAMNDLDQIRDKYSQANGYSTATRKSKTISYINSLNIEIPQKAMLIRKYYKAFRSYNKDIVNYVADLNLSYEEKVAILEQTGMTVNGNNVSWK